MTIEKENTGNSVCESCGKDFSCGAQTGNCWCFEMKIDPEVLADLRENFKNCLCQNCLINKIELLLPRSTSSKN
jgi:hypothetical protein